MLHFVKKTATKGIKKGAVRILTNAKYMMKMGSITPEETNVLYPFVYSMAEAIILLISAEMLKQSSKRMKAM